MSYILEALKKAQAERQLGDMPTIHAAQVVPVAPAGASASRKPLLAGVAAGVVVAGVAATLFWRHQAPMQVAVAVPAAKAPAIAAVAPAVTATAPNPMPTPPGAGQPLPSTASAAAPVARASQAAVASTVPPPPAAHTAQPTRAPVAAPARGKPTPPQVSGPHQDRGAGRQAAAPAHPDAAAAGTVQAPAERTPAPATGPEEYVRTLAELPENIRREVPKVAFGGYMYSPNAADRLVLVDKALRHEGEEIAPGLRLEKLLPKSAVLSYRGYVFRVGL
jgi:general secretion pathway protein B